MTNFPPFIPINSDLYVNVNRIVRIKRRSDKSFQVWYVEVHGKHKEVTVSGSEAEWLNQYLYEIQNTKFSSFI